MQIFVCAISSAGLSAPAAVHAAVQSAFGDAGSEGGLDGLPAGLPIEPLDRTKREEPAGMHVAQYPTVMEKAAVSAVKSNPPFPGVSVKLQPIVLEQQQQQQPAPVKLTSMPASQWTNQRPSALSSHLQARVAERRLQLKADRDAAKQQEKSLSQDDLQSQSRSSPLQPEVSVPQSHHQPLQMEAYQQAPETSPVAVPGAPAQQPAAVDVPPVIKHTEPAAAQILSQRQPALGSKAHSAQSQKPDLPADEAPAFDASRKQMHSAEKAPDDKVKRRCFCF
jgi:hypothetical protein